jgi:hypothetical protein
VKLRQEGATLWAFGAIAYNNVIDATNPFVNVYYERS